MSETTRTILILALFATIFAAGPAFGLVGDQDGDTDIDLDDIEIILAFRNTPASGPTDPKDLDSDGTITILDARIASACCTRPLCAAGGAPTGMDDSGAGFATDEDTLFTTGDVLANDSDPDMDPLSVDSVDATSAEGATITDNGDGTFGYDPTGSASLNALAAGETRTDTFSYTVSDGLLTDTATVSIEVTGINDAPTAVDDSGAGFATPKNAAFTTGDVLANDTDPDTSDTLSVTAVDALSASGATIADNGDGTFTYDPTGVATLNALAAGETATDTFSYTIGDGNGGSDTATVSIEVTGVNDAPTAVDDSGAGFATDEDTAFNTGDVLANDTDPDTTDTLSVSAFDAASAQGAAITDNGDGTFGYDPTVSVTLNALAAGETTTDTFSYTVSDGNGGTDTATVSIEVAGVNDAPTAVDDSGIGFATDEDTLLTTGDVLANDTDPDTSDTLSVSAFDALSAEGAAVADNGDGTFDYDPAGSATLQALATGETTTDTFTYTVSDGNGGTDTATVSIEVTAVNDAPTAVDDSGAGFATDEDTAFNTGDVLANDSDPDTTDTLSVSAFDALSAQGAAITDNGDGTFGYDPTGAAALQALAVGEMVTDTFDYTVSDGNGGTDTATVSIEVTGVNDDPTAVDDSGAGFTTDEDTALTTGDVLANDTDPDTSDTLSVTAADAASAQGVAIVDNGDGTFGYDPTGVAAFQALAAGEMLTDTFGYTVGDGNGGTDTATVSIEVTGVNDPPTAVDDGGAGFGTDEDTAFNTGNVLVNDTDPDTTDTLSVSAFDAVSAQGAAITDNGDGTFGYDPTGAAALQALGAGGMVTDTFTYTASDGNGGTDTATVSVDVTGLNDPPTITMIADQMIDEDTSTGPLAFTIADADDPVFSLVVSASSSNTTLIPNGNLVIGGAAPNLTITATPAMNQFGMATITVTVDDGTAMASEMFTVTVNNVPDPPMAVDDAYTTVGHVELVAGGVAPTSLARVADADGVLTKGTADSDPVEMTAITVVGINGTMMLTGTSTMGGDVTMNADGTFLYVPPLGVKNVADTFTYTVQNGVGGQATATVTITLVDALVWFVHNDPGGEPLNPAGGDGRSNDPFDSLAAADSFLAGPSNPGDTIFVFEGDGTTTNQNGGIRLADGQKLIGHATASHTFGGVAVDIPNPPAGSDRPMIENTAGDGVTVLADLADHTGVEVRGLSIAGTAGNAVDVTAAATHAVGITVDDNFIADSTAEGIDLNPGSSALFEATIANNEFATASPAGNAIDVVQAATAGEVRVAISNNVDVTSSGGTAINVDGSAAASGPLFVTGFAGNSVHGNTGGTGIRIVGAIFDADPDDNDFDTVAGGTTTVGTISPFNPVGTGGVVLGDPGAAATRVSGDLSFARLDVNAGSGSGLVVAGSGVFVAGPPDTGFQLGVTAGTALAFGGPALDLDPATVNAFFDRIDSLASPGVGVRLKDIDGSVTIGNIPPGSAITDAMGTAFEVDAGRAMIFYDGVINQPNAASGFAVEVKNRPAGASDVTFAKDIGAPPGPPPGPIKGQGISVTLNAAGQVFFNGGVWLDTGVNDAVSLVSNAGAAVRFSQGLDIDTTTGSGFVATGGGSVEVLSAGPILTTVDVGAAPHAVDLNGITIGLGDVTFDSINAAGTTSDSIDLDDVSNAGTFVGGVTVINGTTAGDCIDISGATSADVAFASLTLDGCADNGVDFDSTSTGDLTVTGTSNLGTTTGIANTSLHISGFSGNATLGAVNIDNRGGIGIHVDRMNGTTQIGATTIDNQMSSTSGAFIVFASPGSVTCSNLTVDHNGAAGTGVFVLNSSGAVNIQGAGSSITGAGSDTFRVDGGAGNVDYAGTITNNSFRSVFVHRRVGGTVTFAGAIDDDGRGIFLEDNGTGTVNFRGGMTLDTGAFTAFSAIDGGIVEVCATVDCAGGTAVVNAIGATTALSTTAVNIADTTIGANGVTFREVNVDGGANTAIILDDTGALGDFHVTGVDGPCGNTAMTLDCDGGTIENINADAVTLNNTGGLVTLENMLLEDIGATGGAARSQHDGIHGATVGGGLTLDGVTIRRISDQAINGAVFTGMNAGVAATTWDGLRILNSLIENTNRYHVGGTLDNIDEGCVRINGLVGTVEIDNSVIRRGGRLFEAFTASSGMLDMTVQSSDFSLSYKELASSVVTNLGMRVQVEGTADAVIKIGDPQETVSPALGNSFLNVGLESIIIQGGVGASGTVDVLIAQNTFTVNDHDAPVACCNFPQGGVVLQPQVGDFDAIFARNTFTNVANAGGRDGNLVIVGDGGSGEIIVRNNTFNAPFNGTFEIVADGAPVNVLLDSNVYNEDPAFFSPDVGIAFNAPGFHSDAFARNGGTLTLTIRDEDHAPHETRPGLCIACANGTLIVEAQASGGTVNLFLDNVDAPNGFDFNHSGGTFNLFRGAAAVGTPQAVLNANGNTGGDVGPNLYPGMPGLTPPEVTVGGTMGTITSVAGTPALPNPTIP